MANKPSPGSAGDGMHFSQTRYAKSGDVSIAYQVTGNGAFDLVFVPGFVSNLDFQLEHPGWSHLVSRLSNFSRLIRFDKRGTGLSDRIAGIANLEDRMDDVRAVMDAVGSERAALFGVSEGGPMSLLFAATYPERVSAMVLYGSYAIHPTLTDETFLRQQIDSIDRLWGSGEFVKRYFVPNNVAVELPVLARFERQSASPSAVAAILRMNSEIDARHILPMIHAPTLVLHRSRDTRMSIDAGRYLANHIPGAKMVTLPGQNHLFVYEPEMIDRVAGEVEEFLTGSRREIETDRVLATVMFTDIVESTKRAAELGDRQWGTLVDNHDRMVREQLARFRGREIKTLGDGFLATFDGPARAVRCASSIVESLHSLGIDVRVGLHTGEIELKDDDVGGIAVNIAARIAGIAGPGSTLVSSTVRDLVAGSGLRFADQGPHLLKGLPEELHLYAALV
ncbi:adenylate/guanylate cyclase domain-containing protein [Bradyrhizobium sp. Ai1a-2]|uniref:adenylate/guanylate cyclase domain-containing protein n=1 Tax=Bradyrhizobium sp. Ai1a-2 TaxID=196490 RepID=UPI0007E8E694|nr:adenylate/guanylate cyclase domain-containing protein [Bradyrhizobium sp. Ai1a-2]